MKKIFLIPVFLVCITGASPNRVQAPVRLVNAQSPLINIKVDSLNLKASELNQLIRQR